MNDRENVARVVKKRFESIKSRTKKCMPSLPYGRKNMYMMSECDEVLKNDFKWLINFNLKDIPIYDIDKEVPVNKMNEEQRKYRRKENKQNIAIKHSHSYSLSGKYYLLLI